MFCVLGLDTGLLPLHAMAISSSACLATSKLLVSQVLLGLKLPPVPQEPRAQASQLEQQLPAALVPLESP